MNHILIVDDAATVRRYHRSILESGGYSVEEAVNGVEALEKIAFDMQFSLYVIDINMPKLDGYGLLRELRAKNIPQAPAIMVSTEAGDKDKSLAYQVGANLYVIKPIKPEYLLACAATLLGHVPT